MIVSLQKLATVYLAVSSVMCGLRPVTAGAIRKITKNGNQHLGEDNLQNVGVSKKEFEEKTYKELSKENYHFIIETSRKRYQNFDNAMEQMLKSLGFNEPDARGIICYAKEETYNIKREDSVLVNRFLEKAHTILYPKDQNRYNITWGETLNKYDDQTIQHTWNMLKEDANSFEKEKELKQGFMKRKVMGRKSLYPKMDYRSRLKPSIRNSQEHKNTLQKKDDIQRLRALLLRPKKSEKELSMDGSLKK
jgi:hypothetical protein